MEYYGNNDFRNYSLAHFGIKGQRWGQRNYQNADGSYTPAGRIRYGIGQGRRAVSRAASGAVKSAKRAGRSLQRSTKQTVRKTKKWMNAEVKDPITKKKTTRGKQILKGLAAAGATAATIYAIRNRDKVASKISGIPSRAKAATTNARNYLDEVRRNSAASNRTWNTGVHKVRNAANSARSYLSEARANGAASNRVWDTSAHRVNNGLSSAGRHIKKGISNATVKLNNVNSRVAAARANGLSGAGRSIKKGISNATVRLNNVGSRASAAKTNAANYFDEVRRNGSASNRTWNTGVHKVRNAANSARSYLSDIAATTAASNRVWDTSAHRVNNGLSSAGRSMKKGISNATVRLNNVTSRVAAAKSNAGNYLSDVAATTAASNRTWRRRRR